MKFLKVKCHYPGKELDGMPILVNPEFIQAIKPTMLDNVTMLIFHDVESPKHAKENNRIRVKHNTNDFTEILEKHDLIHIIEIP